MTDESLLIECREVCANEVRTYAVQAVVIDLRERAVHVSWHFGATAFEYSLDSHTLLTHKIR